MKNRLLQFFNIRSNEAWLVTNLFLMQFFQGAGIAIFNTVAFAFFLQQFDVKELANVYLFSAALLLITGFLYGKLEHALSIKQLVFVVISFIAVSILFFRIQFFFTNSGWFIFLMFSWYYVIYLLSNLEFWGVAALSFDIRQSKRLFGMIGAGDIPAKLIGYSLVPLLVHTIGNENTLYISFGSVLVALVFYFRIRKAGKLDMHVKHEHKHEHKHEYTTEGAREMVKSFFGNKMILQVALLSFIVVSAVTIITFSFYAEVKHEAHSDEQLAAFIGGFLAGGRVLAIFIRLIFTGRLMNNLGTKGSLLISPAIIFLFLFTVIILPFFTHEHFSVLYVFGLLAIITEVLKTSLQDPVFLSLMQPLSHNLRLKGHTIVKGVMDPFALAFSGVMIFIVLKISGKVDLLVLSYLLFALLLVWVVMIFVVDREYVRSLVTALNKRYSVGQEIDLDNEQTQKVLFEKISSGERGEAIYILHLIEKQFTEDREPMVLRALEHPVAEVKMEAIKLAERKKISAALPYIEQLIQNKTEPKLLPEAVKAKCMLLPDELENFDEFLDEKDHRLMKSAITGLMTSGGINAVVTAGQKLLQLISSPVAEERKIAAEIIGELGVNSFYKPLLHLMYDENKEVASAAIQSAGRVRNQKLMEPLMKMFLQKQNEKFALDAMHAAGDVALNEIKQTLTHENLSRTQQSKLILLCGRIGTDNAAKILDDLVWKIPAMHSDTFHAMHLCAFKSQPNHRTQHLDLMRHYIHAAMRILFMIRETEKTKTAKILVDALHLELNEIRDSLLLLFSFVYDKEKMLKAKAAFHLMKKESVANALEIIEIEVPKELSLVFNKIFEPGDVADKCASLSAGFKEELNYEKIIDSVLHDAHHHFHRWTKAAALHSVIFYKGKYKHQWLAHAQKENDILLKETAGKILAEMN